MSNIYFYREKKEKNYTVIDNTFLKDKRLSAKAKGIFAYLLMLPEDWKIYIKELINNFSDGETSIRNGIKELIKYGYIKVNKKRNDKGQFIATIYYIIENPDLENLNVDNSDLDNQALQNTNNTKYLNKQNTKENNKSNQKEKIFTFDMEKELKKALIEKLPDRKERHRLFWDWVKGILKRKSDGLTLNQVLDYFEWFEEKGKKYFKTDRGINRSAFDTQIEKMFNWLDEKGKTPKNWKNQILTFITKR